MKIYLVMVPQDIVGLKNHEVLEEVSMDVFGSFESLRDAKDYIEEKEEDCFFYDNMSILEIDLIKEYQYVIPKKKAGWQEVSLTSKKRS